MNKKILDPKVTADVVIFTISDGELKTLLIKRAGDPYKNSYALPGGFLYEGETTKTGAERVLSEKAGIRKVFMEQLYTFDSPGRDPRGPIFSIAYFALSPENDISIKSTPETQHPEFISINKLPKLAFDHKEIIKYAAKRLQYKLEYTNAASSLLPKEFTINQLQKIYEIIFDKNIDKRNFRRKFMQLNLIEPVKGRFELGHQRPAQLYRFKIEKPVSLKNFF